MLPVTRAAVIGVPFISTCQVPYIIGGAGLQLPINAHLPQVILEVLLVLLDLADQFVVAAGHHDLRAHHRLVGPHLWLGTQGIEEVGQRHGRDADGSVRDAVREHQGLGVHECAAGVDDVGHVAVPLVGGGAEERLP